MIPRSFIDFDILSIKYKISLDNSHKYDYNSIMKKEKYIVLFSVLSFISLFVGMIIYLFYRENSYISIYLHSLLNVPYLPDLLGLGNNKFIRFYFVDYLWVFSLSCGLHCVFIPRMTGSLIITAVVFLYGSIYEILQFYAIIDGTGDILDVLLYALAGITVNIINLQRRKTK